MTSDTLTLSDVRVLLDRYYDGLTTPAEEGALTSYFLTNSDVPADMAADRQIFVAIAHAAAVAPPSDLEARIVAATCGTHRRPALWRCISVAASVAVTAAIGSLLFLNMQETTENHTEQAEENIFTALVNHPDTILRVEEKTKPAAEAPAVAEASSVVVSPHRHNVAYNSARCVEITDSAQMAEAMRLIDRELAGCFASVGAGIKDTRETFSSIDKTINKISK